MRFLGWLLLGALLLSVLRVGLAVLLAAIVLMWLFLLVKNPRQAIAAVFGLILLSLFAKHPLPFLALLTLLRLTEV